MIDIYIIRAYILLYCNYIVNFLCYLDIKPIITSFNNIKMKILTYITRLINKFNNFYTLTDIYRLNIKNDKIYKNKYSLVYYNVIYTCYHFPILYPLYYMLFILNPILSDIYVLTIKHNNTYYKLIVDNNINNNIDMIFNFKGYILTSKLFEMKYINLECSNDPLNTNSFTININQYLFNNAFQNLNYIMIDINSDYSVLNYIIPLNIKITDLIDDTYNISINVNNKIFETNISILCEQYILNYDYN